MTASEVDEVLDWARGLGCRVVRLKSGHYRVAWRSRTVAVVAGTPSGRRSLLNSRADIRRGIRKVKEEKAWQGKR